MKKPSNIILIFQAALTVVGAVTSVIMFNNLLGEADILSILNSVIYIAVYVFLFIYAIFKYKDDDKYFRIMVYAYAALLGIDVLFAGNMIKGFGLGENTILVLNAVNLTSFAFVIKFVDILEQRKKAIIYMSISNALKFLMELYLIIKMINFIQPIHILTALSVPVLGTTILVAYMHRFGD